MMSKSNLVVNLVLNDFTCDSRVLKSSLYLTNIYENVVVVALHSEGLSENTIIDGINVHRIKLRTRKWSKNKFIQILKYLEFIIKFVWRFRRSVCVVCNDLDALIVGSFCKFTKFNIKLIYDSHEYAVDDIPSQPRFSIFIKYVLETLFIRFASEVITVSNTIARKYKEIHFIKKPHVVLNCPKFINIEQNNIFRNIFAITDNQKIFLYQGGIVKGRGIELIIEVFAKKDLQDVIIFMGDGDLSSFVMNYASKNNNIFYHKAVPVNDLMTYTSSADFGISFIEDTCLSYRYCLPNKLFEYIMAGLPVITSKLPEMSALVKSESVGIVANDNSVIGIREAVFEIKQKEYESLRKNVLLARKKFCWEDQELVLDKVFHGFF